MSTVTTPAATAVQPSPDLVNALLKWPAEDRAALAHLLLDSVKEGFTSLEEIGQRDRELIRGRIETYERGGHPASDWREALSRVEAKFRAEFPR